MGCWLSDWPLADWPCITTVIARHQSCRRQTIRLLRNVPSRRDYTFPLLEDEVHGAAQPREPAGIAIQAGPPYVEIDIAGAEDHVHPRGGCSADARAASDVAGDESLHRSGLGTGARGEEQRRGPGNHREQRRGER